MEEDWVVCEVEVPQEELVAAETVAPACVNTIAVVRIADRNFFVVEFI